MERTIRFNNAGIQLLRHGRYDVAHDCFRASLEIKLAHDRLQMERQRNPRQQVRSVSPECISVAEEHLANLSAHLSEGRRVSISSSDDDGSHEGSGGGGGGGGRRRRLYIYSDGFVMPEESVSTIQLRSSMNVFNLGLVHQLKDRTAEKARDFYKVAATLMALEASNARIAHIRLAVINNYGVWCHDNGDIQQAKNCMEQVAIMLEGIQETLTPEVLHGIQANVEACRAEQNEGTGGRS